jgi:competence protein ComEC
MLLATFIFFLVRGLLALFPYLALRLPTKKIAAVVAFVVTGFYLLISGMQVPAIRSFMMISLVFLGVLTDRKVVSLYTLCLVAFAVLLVRPEWITSASFQLSFVAVMVLVSVFEDVSKHLPKGLFCRVVVTGLIANILVTLALAPFVAYHFNQFNPYGAIGNMLISVLFSFFIMPLLFVSAILMLFHWDAPVLKCVGFMLDQVTFLAGKVAAWPGSEIIVPSFSCWGLSVIAIGIVLLCVMKTRWRFGGFAFILVGCALGWCLRQQPDLVVFKQGKTILARQQDKFVVVKGNAEDWLVQRFVRQQGQDKIDAHKVKTIQIKNARVALDLKHCKDANLAILTKENVSCKAKEVFVPQDYSPYKIFLNDSIEIQNEARDNDHRPWGLKFKRKENK